jgi:hypothetical protein
MLGDIFDGAEKKEVAANYYSRIVKNYPLSKYVPDAKTKLVAMKVPVPQPDPKSQAWMVAEQNAPRPRTSLVKRPMGILKSGPTTEMRSAAQVGTPTMEAEPDTASATDVLTGGNSSRIVVGGGRGSGNSTGSTTGIVATVTPGTRAENSGASEGAAPAGGSAAPADSGAPPATDSNAPGATPPESISVTPAGESSSAAPADTSAGAAGGSDAAGTAGTDAAKTDAAKTDAAKTDTAKADSDGKTKESTSKKKKGVRKLVPW